LFFYISIYFIKTFTLVFELVD